MEGLGDEEDVGNVLMLIDVIDSSMGSDMNSVVMWVAYVDVWRRVARVSLNNNVSISNVLIVTMMQLYDGPNY